MIRVIIPKITFWSGKLVMQERDKTDSAANIPPARQIFCLTVKTSNDMPMKVRT